jgi:hypothetical protein
MLQKYLAIFLVIVLLNGALFNRIGGRIAEHSYITAMLDLLLDNFGLDHSHSLPIKVGKRMLPTSNQGSSSVVKTQSNTDNEQHIPYLFIRSEVAGEVFSYQYTDAISDAHKPPVFKPPA